MATTAAQTTGTRPSIAHREYPDPTWSDAQRTAWEAIRAVYLAKEMLYHAYATGALPSAEPATRAWLAWMEAEREYALIHIGTGIGEGA